MNPPPIHIMPNDGRHSESKDCFCHPVLLEVVENEEGQDVEVWSHNDTRKEALH